MRNELRKEGRMGGRKEGMFNDTPARKTDYWVSKKGKCNEMVFKLKIEKNIKNSVKNCAKGRRKEMFYLTTHSTHFIYGYMASDMVKDHSDSKRGNPLLLHGLIFPFSSKGHRHDNTYHSLCCANRVALAGTRNVSQLKISWNTVSLYTNTCPFVDEFSPLF